MNLLNKIGRTYLWLSFLCLLVAVPLIFLVLDRAAKAETTEKLTLQAERIFQLLEKGQDLTPMEPVEPRIATPTGPLIPTLHEDPAERPVRRRSSCPPGRERPHAQAAAIHYPSPRTDV